MQIDRSGSVRRLGGDIDAPRTACRYKARLKKSVASVVKWSIHLDHTIDSFASVIDREARDPIKCVGGAQRTLFTDQPLLHIGKRYLERQLFGDFGDMVEIDHGLADEIGRLTGCEREISRRAKLGRKESTKKDRQ